MQTLTEDRIKTTEPGFAFPAADTWIFQHGIMVSSTLKAGVYCDHDDSVLINHATILSAMPSPTTGEGRGVWFDSDNITLINAADGIVIGYLYGVYVSGVSTTITNHGLIESFNFGIGGTADLHEIHVDNSGIIRGRNFGIDVLDAGGTIHNSGLIEGTTSDGISGNFQSHAHLSIVNEAGEIIRGASRAVDQVSYAGLSLQNRGTIVGEIHLTTDGGNLIRNSGVIAGRIVLGDGADIFNGQGGKSGAVFGGKGSDTLAGGNAADRLDGGPGHDILTGRGGKDKFVFSTDLSSPNIDRITDFTVNIDKIVLDTDVFHVGSPGGLAAARFHVGSQAADASDRIIYNPNTGALFFDHDGLGGDPQAKLAQLARHLALDHADFAVIG